MKRRKMGGKESRGNFSRNASKTHKKNLNTGNPMRGGIRL
ncbi:MAG: hypothetical protein [Microvirus sp.]|nr:MAG: hypothetical protein [Microvirus sp.]